MTEVAKLRASGAPGVRFAAQHVGRDAAGSWLLVPAGTAHLHDGGWVEFLSPNPVLLLVPDATCWVASTSYGGAKIDLVSSVRLDRHGLAFVDLELDVVWRWGERARLEDVEEFAALGLAPADAACYLAAAHRLRNAVDAGADPLGPGFRQRLVELAGPGDPHLRSTWAGGVASHLADAVASLVGPEWLERQGAGGGWLLCGGGAGVSAVAWVEGPEPAVSLLHCDATPSGQAMASFLLGAGKTLAGVRPPPLGERSLRRA